MDNVIEFPQPCMRVSQTDSSHAGGDHIKDASRIKHGKPICGDDDLDAMSLVVLDKLNRLKQTDRPGALCILRINEYHPLEETFGKRIGRKLQDLIGNRLRTSLRGNDLLESITDDEFVIILEGQVDNDLLIGIVQRLLRDCSGIYAFEGLRMHVDACMGVARFPVDVNDPVLLMRYARIALHECNQDSTTSHHFFSQNLLEQLQVRVGMAAEIETALANNRFELYYQPMFDIQSQRILGAEALLRLRTDDGALITPEYFIPQAVEMGMIVSIGHWVIRNACQQLKHWRQQGINLQRMTVNVTSAQIADECFIASVTEAVENADIDYSDLELEITNVQLTDSLPLIDKILEKLNTMGVYLAIDDFGNSCSAMAYLTRIYWKTLKIDRCLLAQVPHEINSVCVVSAIIDMAGELGLQVTAEGIETEEQYRFLYQVGCNNGQGYGYARPQQAENFQQLLQMPDTMGWSKI